MSLWHIAWSYLWDRKFTTCLTIMSVALGVGLITAVLTLREETRKRFEEEGQSFDLVVGSPGSGLQLVLSTVYYMDMPYYPIPWSYYENIKAREDEVKAAFPVAMGDSYSGQRIVGTTRAMLDFDWGEATYVPFKLAKGRFFDAPLEAVVGALAAKITGLKIGDSFVGGHGMTEHEEHPYTVVGILQRSGTPSDRAIFCDIQSIWNAHAHEKEEGEDLAAEGGLAEHDDERRVSAVLVKLYSPALRGTVKQALNREMNVMATVPVEEIRKLYGQLLESVKVVLMAIGYLVVVISSLSILIGLYMSILQRKRDLAVMRALGAARGEIFGAVLIEAFWVSVLGIAAGWVTGAVACMAVGRILTERIGFTISAISLTPELGSAYSAVLVMGIMAGIIPAWQAYRTDVAHDLAEL